MSHSPVRGRYPRSRGGGGSLRLASAPSPAPPPPSYSHFPLRCLLSLHPTPNFDLCLGSQEPPASSGTHPAAPPGRPAEGAPEGSSVLPYPPPRGGRLSSLACMSGLQRKGAGRGNKRLQTQLPSLLPPAADPQPFHRTAMLVFPGFLSPPKGGLGQSHQDRLSASPPPLAMAPGQGARQGQEAGADVPNLPGPLGLVPALLPSRGGWPCSFVWPCSCRSHSGSCPDPTPPP